MSQPTPAELGRPLKALIAQSLAASLAGMRPISEMPDEGQAIIRTLEALAARVVTVAEEDLVTLQQIGTQAQLSLRHINHVLIAERDRVKQERAKAKRQQAKEQRSIRVATPASHAIH